MEPLCVFQPSIFWCNVSFTEGKKKNPYPYRACYLTTSWTWLNIWLLRPGWRWRLAAGSSLKVGVNWFVNYPWG